MPDPCDIAQKSIEQSEEIRERQRLAMMNKPRRFSEFCIDCDTLIPEGRQLATGGIDRCTQCQDFHNKRNGIR